MKRLSTFLCTLALLLVGASSARAEVVYEVNYSDYTSFPWYVMGFTPTFVDGIMTDGGGGWHQYYIANDIPTVVGNDYKVKALVKASAAVTFNVEMRWSWSGDYQKTNTNVTVPKSNEFVEVEWNYRNIGGASCGLIAQPNSDAKIEWKSLKVLVDDTPVYNITYNMVEKTPTMYAKSYGGDTDIATPDGDGVYTVTDKVADAQPWGAQFWIKAPTSLSAGQQFYIEFKYKATNAGTVGTQTHNATPGGYIIWHCIGDVNFTDEWQTFQKTQTVEGDMDGWQSIAFNMHLGALLHDDVYAGTNTTYSIKDIVLKLPEVAGETVSMTVTSAGWATYSSAYDVDLGTTNGYAVKSHGSYVELIPVTEVPAGKAVLIEGANKHVFDVIPSAAAIAENDLKISDGSVTGDGSTIYALGKKGGVVGFAMVKSGTKVPNGKAYIVIAGGGAREFIGFNEEATGIEAVQQDAKADNQYFNLAGQRVAQPTKGLYIVNGKKVIVK
jgi:hypothetical protein